MPVPGSVAAPVGVADAPQDPSAWHSLARHEVLQALASGPGGLDSRQAAERLARHGPNQLARSRRRGPALRLLLQFHNVLLYIMLAAAGITAFLGHWIDTAVLLAAVVVNALIGFVQEGKAESA